jgi:hypothetical protein
MSSQKQTIFFASLLFVTAFSQQSSAVFTTTTTFLFHGTCSDCTGQGTATLVLGNYTPGANITTANFASFTYSSNLISYTINPGELAFASGVIPAGLPAAANVTLGANPCCSRQFTSSTSGSWCSGLNCADDIGTGGLWAFPSNPGAGPTGVPALTDVSLGCLAVAIAVMGGILLKRRQAA